MTCKNCGELHVGSIITAFRVRLNNHKSFLIRNGKGQMG